MEETVNQDKTIAEEKKYEFNSREDLSKLDKHDLIELSLQLKYQNDQLQNIIKKKSNISETAIKRQLKPFDFSKCHYRRILLHVLYFGWDYQGFVVQEDTDQTIEQHLFYALKKACLIENREGAKYHRCGRTDKGVSAFGQVISLSVRSKFPVNQQYKPEFQTLDLPYCQLLNRLLPRDIRAVAWMPIPLDQPDFSARFDCKKRQYKYYFPRCSLNLQAMQSACTRLVGSHDFRNLCKMDVGNGVTEFRRNIFKAGIIPVNNKDLSKPTSMYYLLIEGNAFLWHQIRCIMGVLLLIGQENERPDIIEELLDVEKNPRKPQYNMAIDLPLNLFRCWYDLKGPWICDKRDLRTVIMQLQSEWTLHNIRATMMKDVINQLEAQYSVTCAREIAANDEIASDTDIVIAYSNCLLQGVKPKVYTPLMKRKTCSSLEERVEHYAKKRKLADPSESGNSGSKMTSDTVGNKSGDSSSTVTSDTVGDKPGDSNTTLTSETVENMSVDPSPIVTSDAVETSLETARQ